jgi:hypothetical protein
MKPNTQYIVTKPSNDGSFLLGDKIVLKDDGRIWIGDDYVEPEDISTAIVGMEYKLTTAPPCQMSEHEFYVIMLKRKDGQVYADLAKSSETIYLTRQEAERALDEEFVIDGHTAKQWHVVRLLARLPTEGYPQLVAAAPEMCELLEYIRDTATIEFPADTLNQINQLLAKIEGGGE